MITPFGDWLRRLRETRRLSQEGLGKDLGFSTETVRKFERRGGTPSEPFAKALTSYLDFSGARAVEFEAFVRGAPANEHQQVADWLGDLIEPKQSRRAPTNLPAPLTRLVGRHGEVDAQYEVLKRPDVRLLTCLGSAGTGKTRLALAIGERMRDVARDGVYLVELAPLQHARDIERAIANSLRLRDIAGRSTFETLRDYLRLKHMLLILDNLEHLAVDQDPSHPGAAQQLIGRLLASAPFLKVLATSRVRLRIAGERLHTVQPFAPPDATRNVDLKTIARNPAIELFVERVRDARPEFTLDASNAEAIQAICRYVDGIPLAIELAAARGDTLEPQALEALLYAGTRLATLVSGPLDHDQRHRTLRASIAWSYGLLDARGRQVFARLGVFVGGFSVAAANAVLRGGHAVTSSNERETSGLLTSLVEASLLRVARGMGARYSMLETLREFALEELRASGEWDVAAQEHALYYVHLAEQIEPELVGKDQASRLEQCELEHANVRDALRWLLDHDEVEAAARLGSALWRFWWTRGHLTDGRAWLDVILGSTDALPPRLRARVLTGNGILTRTQRSFERATSLLSEALTFWRHQHNLEWSALALVNLGIVAENLLDYDHARERYLECLDFYRQAEDERGEAHVLNNLSVLAIDEGDFPAAREYGLESLAIFQRLKIDERGKALVQRNLGWIATAQGQYPEGREWLEASLAISRRLGDGEATANALNNLALLIYTEGKSADSYRLAHALAGDGLRLLYELGDYAGMAESIEIVSACAGKLSDARAAARGFGVAEALRASVRIAHFPSQLETYRGMVAEARQRLDQNDWSEAWAEGSARPDEFIAECLGRVGVSA